MWHNPVLCALVLTGLNSFVAKDNSSDLAFFDSNTGHTIMKVDNTSFVPFNEKRRTVRITSDDAYGVGSVFVFDVFHIPFGVSSMVFRLHHLYRLTLPLSVLCGQLCKCHINAYVIHL